MFLLMSSCGPLCDVTCRITHLVMGGNVASAPNCGRYELSFVVVSVCCLGRFLCVGKCVR